MRDPSEIRGVFPANLARLMEREASVSSFCRAVGLNRTQFNRYLSGESSPRPEVLSKICDHFGVDARILLEPLQDDEDHAVAAPIIGAFGELLKSRQLDVSDTLLPNGFYRRWRNSISQPGEIAHMLTYVKNENGARTYRTFAKKMSKESGPMRRRIRGVLIGSADSFLLVTKFEDGPTLCNAVFEYQYRSLEGIYPGISLYGRARHPNVRRLVREVMEFIPSDPKRIREIARHPQFCAIEETPLHVQEILSEPLTDLQ